MQTSIQMIIEEVKRLSNIHENRVPSVLLFETLFKAEEIHKQKTEISDEEIESAAKECRFEDLDISVGSFELGAKWYREQLKKQ